MSDAMKVIYICFPEGKHKVLTMSYDDGKLADRRLVSIFNHYGIKGTSLEDADQKSAALGEEVLAMINKML